MLSSIFEAFVKESPMSRLLRGVMEGSFRPQQLDAIFESHAKVQYTRDWLFSTLVQLLSLVVCGLHPSVNAADKAKAAALNVSRGAVYQTLNGVELAVSAGLVRETAGELAQFIEPMGGQAYPLLAGSQVRILDGNALAATEHRLGVLRSVAGAPLPSKALVVLEPRLRLAVALFPCEDGHAQERWLFGQVLATVKPGQLWIADRNRCTLDFLGGIAQRQACLVIRAQQNLPWQALEYRQVVTATEAGELFEQTMLLASQSGSCPLRRIVLRLNEWQ